MEVEPTKRRREQHQQRPEGDEAHARRRKRRRTSGGVGPAAGPEDLEEEEEEGGGGGSGVGLVTLLSSPSASEGVRAEHAAETPLPCTDDQGESQAPQGPGSPEIIIIDDDDDEEQKNLEFEKEIAALKAEIARLEALAKELQSQEGDK